MERVEVIIVILSNSRFVILPPKDDTQTWLFAQNLNLFTEYVVYLVIDLTILLFFFFCFLS